MSGNKGKQWEEQQKKAREEAAKAKLQNKGVSTGASGGIAAKRASVAEHFQPRTPSQTAPAQKSQSQHAGPTDAKFGSSNETKSTSSIDPKKLAAEMSKKHNVTAGRSMAEKSREQYEEQLKAAGRTEEEVKPQSPKPKTSSTDQSGKPKINFSEVTQAKLKPTSTIKSPVTKNPEQPKKTESSPATGFQKPTNKTGKKLW